jgi:hypothetical protein
MIDDVIKNTRNITTFLGFRVIFNPRQEKEWKMQRYRPEGKRAL